MKKTNNYPFTALFFLFLSFSFAGWLYEVGLAFFYDAGFINRGFLHGPFLPIYGFGGVILVLLLANFMQREIKIGKISITPLLVFLLVMAITTAIEYLAGVVLEALFHQRWWDYSHYSFNFQGLVALNPSVRFGLGGLVFLYLLTPLILKLLGFLTPKARKIMVTAAVLFLLGDFALTISKLL